MSTFRDENFAVEVKPERELYREYPDEVSLKLTHNGYQWTAYPLNEREAKMICNALKKHFRWRVMK